MAVPYPLNLTPPMIASYSITDAVKIVKNNVQIGAPRFELLTTSSPVFYKVKWSFSQDEFAVFDGWFKYDLIYGSKSFLIKLKTSAGLSDLECYFSSAITSTLKGKRWQITAKILSLTKSTISELEYNDQADDIASGGAGGGGGSYSYRTSVSQNKAIDYFRFDETVNDKALNSGVSTSGYTKESLVYDTNLVSAASEPSSIDSNAGKSRTINATRDRVSTGATPQSASIPARSPSWGYEFAIKFNNVVDGDVIFSFWDDTAAEADQLLRLAVSGDLLVLELNTTNDDLSFTNRITTLIPSLAAIDDGNWHYISIFYDQFLTLDCQLDGAEVASVDVSLWESRLSRSHTTGRFRVGADSDQNVNIFDGSIDELSIYAGKLGYYFDRARSFNWWKCSQYNACDDVIIPSGDFVATVTSLAPVAWWRLNETSGIALADSGLRNNAMTAILDLTAFDQPPSSLFLGGSSRSKLFDNGVSPTKQYAVSDTGAAAQITDNSTIEFALNRSTFDQGVVITCQTDDGVAVNSQYELFVGSVVDATDGLVYSDSLGITFYDPVLDFTRTTHFLGDLSNFDGQWVWVSISLNYANNTINARINNTESSSRMLFGTPFNNAPIAPLSSIGGRPAQGGNNLSPSSLDEITIYDKILTSIERDIIYNLWFSGNVDSNSGLGNTAITAINNALNTRLSDQTTSEAITIPSGQVAAWRIDENMLGVQALYSFIPYDPFNPDTGNTIEIWETLDGVNYTQLNAVDASVGNNFNLIPSVNITGAYILYFNNIGADRSISISTSVD